MNFYLTLTLIWAPSPDLSLEAGPYFYTATDKEYIEVQPLTLSWSPSEGFGAQSSYTYAYGGYGYPAQR